MKLVAVLRAHARRLHEEQESGVAMTEFAIAFPLQLFVTLAIMQFSLILIGHVLTQQAAFAAARSALVYDVPRDGAQNGGQVAADMSGQAKRAAAYVLMPLCPTNSEWAGFGGPATPANGAIQLGTDDRSIAAFQLVRGANGGPIITTGPNDDYVGAAVEFEMVLTIPVVNHWFAKIGVGGNPGEFWYGPNNGAAGYNAASNARKITVLTMMHSAFLPRPWRAQ